MPSCDWRTRQSWPCFKTASRIHVRSHHSMAAQPPPRGSDTPRAVISKIPPSCPCPRPGRQTLKNTTMPGLAPSSSVSPRFTHTTVSSLPQGDRSCVDSHLLSVPSIIARLHPTCHARSSLTLESTPLSQLFQLSLCEASLYPDERFRRAKRQSRAHRSVCCRANSTRGQAQLDRLNLCASHFWNSAESFPLRHLFVSRFPVPVAAPFSRHQHHNIWPFSLVPCHKRMHALCRPD